MGQRTAEEKDAREKRRNGNEDEYGKSTIRQGRKRTRWPTEIKHVREIEVHASDRGEATKQSVKGKHAVLMSGSSGGELKSRAKDKDNIRFTQRYCLALWLPLTAVHLNETHLEATSDHTQDGKHTSPAPFQSNQGDLRTRLAVSFS